MTWDTASHWWKKVHETDWARAALTVVGVVLAATGVLSLSGVMAAVQGEGLVLLVAGVALILLGTMVALRWNLPAAKTGLIGLTAGYFATALSEFEVATDPCDIGGTLERCATDAVIGSPWVVYQGPMILGALVFAVVALEPVLAQSRSVKKRGEP